MIEGLFQFMWSLVRLRFAALFLLLLARCQLTFLVEPGPFEMTIDRGAATAQEAALILAAESRCPDGPLSSVCDDVGSSGEACRWWCDEREGIRIPIAVTGEAWKYYQDEIAAMRQAAESQQLQRGVSASFKYSARVRHFSAPILGITDEVDLQIEWSYHCGGPCGFSFTIERTVSFDGDGTIVRVFGDGYPGVSIS